MGPRRSAPLALSLLFAVWFAAIVPTAPTGTDDPVAGASLEAAPALAVLTLGRPDDTAGGRSMLPEVAVIVAALGLALPLGPRLARRSSASRPRTSAVVVGVPRAPPTPA
jgi:hypothetical protein